MSITALMSSQDTAVFQGAVRFQVAQIEPVEQPQELLLAELDRRRPGNIAGEWFKMKRPLEFLLLQPFQPKAEPRPLPIQNFS